MTGWFVWIAGLRCLVVVGGAWCGRLGGARFGDPSIRVRNGGAAGLVYILVVWTPVAPKALGAGCAECTGPLCAGCQPPAV